MWQTSKKKRKRKEAQTVKETTLKCLLRVLDSQKAHAAARPEDPIQAAYYLGIRMAINAAYSETYTQGGFIDIDKNGKHFITR